MNASTLTFATYQPSDFFLIDLQRAQALETGSPELAEQLAGDHALTCWNGDKAVAAFGVMRVGPGVGEAWGRFSDDGVPTRSWPTLARRIRRQHQEAVLGLALWRLQMFVRADFAAGRRLAEVLGFEYEGVMVAAEADGESRLIYRRLLLHRMPKLAGLQHG